MDYEQTEALVDKVLAKYSSAQNILMTSEFGRINDKFNTINDTIAGLRDQVSTQNGSVRSLKEWKAEHCEQTKSLNEKIDSLTLAKAARLDVSLRYITIFLTIISVTAAIYFGNQNIKIREKVQKEASPQVTTYK